MGVDEGVATGLAVQEKKGKHPCEVTLLADDPWMGGVERRTARMELIRCEKVTDGEAPPNARKEKKGLQTASSAGSALQSVDILAGGRHLVQTG